MKRRLLSVLILSFALFAQCGKKDLILVVDLMSYVAPELRTVYYGPVLPGLPDVMIGLIQAQVNLLEMVDDMTEVKSTALRVGAKFDNQSGSATASLAVYVAPIDLLDPFNFTPVTDIHVSLKPDQTTNVSEEIPSTPEVLEILTQDLAWFGVKITANTQGSPGILWGKVTLTELTAILVTEADL